MAPEFSRFDGSAGLAGDILCLSRANGTL